jgi:hypothetical protein
MCRRQSHLHTPTPLFIELNLFAINVTAPARVRGSSQTNSKGEGGYYLEGIRELSLAYERNGS